MVIAVIMMTIALPVAASLGVLPTQMIYLITVGCTIAFMLPPASAAATFLFANTGWLRAKAIYKFALPTLIWMLVIALLWNILWFSII